MIKIIAFAMAVLLVACSGSDAGSTSQTTGPPDQDPNEPVLMVTSEGGFVPAEFQLDRMPRYLVTADRTLYYQGPVPAIFPGPLLPNVQVGTISQASWEEILRLVEEVGLPEITEKIDNENAENVADATTEFVTYHDDDGAHRYGVYALGLTDDRGSSERVLIGEIIQLLDEAASEGQSNIYVPERLQVAAGLSEMVDPQLASVEPWPLDMTRTSGS